MRTTHIFKVLQSCLDPLVMNFEGKNKIILIL